MIELEFMLAQKEDLENVLAMFTGAINEMNKNGIDQWDSIYPDRNLLEEDIIKKQLFIGLYEGTVLSAYVLNRECDEQYVNGTLQHRCNFDFTTLFRYDTMNLQILVNWED